MPLDTDILVNAPAGARRGGPGAAPRLRWLAFLAALALAAQVAGCCSWKKRHRCEASASYGGAVRKGRGTSFTDEAGARQSALGLLCIDYCGESDPGVEAAVRAANKGATASGAERFNISHNPPVKATLDACVARCKASLTPDKVEQKCSYSGLY